jgi:hypothetical protein
MSRNVIIKALLPHRDTISTMIISPRILRPALYISPAKQCMRQVSKQRKKARFSLGYVLNNRTEIAPAIG